MTVTRKELIIGLVVVCSVVLAVLIDWLVKSDSEKIVSAINDIRAAAAQGEVEGVFHHISQDYSDEEVAREQLVSLGRRCFEIYGPIRVNILSIQKNISGRIALTRVKIAVSARDARGQGAVTSTWELSWRKERDGAWRVRGLTPLKVGDREIDGWDYVGRLFRP